jgi:hypothetical protein
MLGGRTNHWGRISLRMGPDDFKRRSLDGIGDDWPITYDEVKPFYDKLDRLVGIFGSMEGIPNEPDGVFQPPPKPRCYELLIKQAADRLKITCIPSRMSIITKPDDAPAAVRGFEVAMSLAVIAPGGLPSTPRMTQAPASSWIAAAIELRGIEGPSSGSSVATTSMSPRAFTAVNRSLMLDLPILSSRASVLAGMGSLVRAPVVGGSQVSSTFVPKHPVVPSARTIAADVTRWRVTEDSTGDLQDEDHLAVRREVRGNFRLWLPRHCRALLVVGK